MVCVLWVHCHIQSQNWLLFSGRWKDPYTVCEFWDPFGYKVKYKYKWSNKMTITAITINAAFKRNMYPCHKQQSKPTFPALKIVINLLYSWQEQVVVFVVVFLTLKKTLFWGSLRVNLSVTARILTLGILFCAQERSLWYKLLESLFY